MSNPELPDFDRVEQLLTAAGAASEAAEAHGAFCGRACLSGATAIRPWVADVLGEEDSGNVLAGERVKTMEALAAQALLALEAGDMSFNLLLPTEDAPLYERTAGLVDWCHGFMHGMVMGGAADEGPQSDALEADVINEILEDFSQITKAGAGEDESDEAESAYAELVEYVRVSAQLVYDETADLRKQMAAEGKA